MLHYLKELKTSSSLKTLKLQSDIAFLEAKLAKIEEELFWKDKLLRERTATLYNIIQEGQESLKKMPEGFVL